MDASPQGTLTDLKHLFQGCYAQLSEMAHRKLMYERSGHTLDTSGLVHEVYDKLQGQQSSRFNNSGHFLAIASITMRRILINYARDKKRQKRGGDLIQITFDRVNESVHTTPEQIISLHDALNKLRKFNKRQSRVVEYHFFGGFSLKEIAEYLQVSEETIRRDWRLARAWLSLELKKEL